MIPKQFNRNRSVIRVGGFKLMFSTAELYEDQERGFFRCSLRIDGFTFLQAPQFPFMETMNDLRHNMPFSVEIIDKYPGYYVITTRLMRIMAYTPSFCVGNVRQWTLELLT